MSPIEKEDVMQTEAERPALYRQLRTDIRGSEHHLIVGLDIAKEKHHAFSVRLPDGCFASSSPSAQCALPSQKLFEIVEIIFENLFERFQHGT